MNKEHFILTYRRNGVLLITVEDYYERYIKPLDKRFARFGFHNSTTVVCPFKSHNDRTPSFGLMAHREYAGVKLYHCFGCNAIGSVVTLHQRIQLDYFGRTLSLDESADDLLKLYCVSAEADAVEEQKLTRQERIMCINAKVPYTVRDFERDLLYARDTPNMSADARASLINTAVIKISVSKKRMISG